MARVESIFQALGGSEVLEASSPSLETLRDRIRQGLPFTALEALMANFGLDRDQLSTVLDLPTRTMTRRKAERHLRPDESDRLFRLARIAAQATEVLGSSEKASLWLGRSNRALGGQVPLEILDTDLGARQVEEVLGRIEHGVHS